MAVFQSQHSGKHGFGRRMMHGPLIITNRNPVV